MDCYLSNNVFIQDSLTMEGMRAAGPGVLSGSGSGATPLPPPPSSSSTSASSSPSSGTDTSTTASTMSSLLWPSGTSAGWCMSDMSYYMSKKYLPILYRKLIYKILLLEHIVLLDFFWNILNLSNIYIYYIYKSANCAKR